MSVEDSDNAELLDRRLMPFVVAAKTGQVVERHWEFFKATYFPGMSDKAAQAALLAWAERNSINVSVHSSFGIVSRSLRVTHVRFAPQG